MDEKNYLFPFDEVTIGKRIIIYGAAQVGQIFYEQIVHSNYGVLVAFADRNADKCEGLAVPVIFPSEINKYKYDYVVIAIESNDMSNQVALYLNNECDVPQRKIVKALNCVYTQRWHPVKITEELRVNSGFAFQQKDAISIAFCVGEGLGDCIIAKRFIDWIMVDAPINCNVDLYGKVSFIQTIYNDCNFLYNVFSPSKLYNVYCNKYDLSVNVGYIISIDVINMNIINLELSSWVDKILNLQQEIQTYGLDNTHVTDNAIHFMRCKLTGKNAYTAHCYGDDKLNFDWHIKINLLDEAECSYNNMLMPMEYITINYGWGELPAGSSAHVKAWNIEKYVELIKLLKNKFVELKIVQLGAEHSKCIEGVDKYILGESLEIVKYVLLHSSLHIDCEGGLVHLATQLGTKCAVLFGPTPHWYFAYKENINIISPACEPCYYLKEDFSACIRGLSKAECMDSISSQFVMDKITGYLQKKLGKAEY